MRARRVGLRRMTGAHQRLEAGLVAATGRRSVVGCWPREREVADAAGSS